MPDPHVTVVLATRNRAAYLDAALTSLVAQESCEPFEIVVVDNGSYDDTATVVARWSTRDPRIRSVYEPVAGLSRAKNAGIAAARGQVLLFTDDDVIVNEHWMASLLDGLAQHADDLTLVGGSVIPVPNDLGRWPAWFDEEALVEAGALDLPAGAPVRSPQYIWGANMASRAKLFDLVGAFDEDLGRRLDERGTFEDTELQDRVRQAGGEIWFRPDARLEHRIPRDTITPREIVLRAFSRGGYEYRIAAQHSARTRTGSRFGAIAKLVIAVPPFLLYILAFRVSSSVAFFRRLRRASFRLGHRLERYEPLDTDQRHQRLAKFVRRIVWSSRRFIPAQAIS